MNKLKIGIVAIALLIGISIGAYFLPISGDGVRSDNDDNPEEVLFYRNPMNPNVTSPVPAKDSMGMDYIPVYKNNDATAEKKGTVSIDPVIVQNIGVRTSKAVKSDLGRTVHAVGRVGFNEERISLLHPKIEGWIENIRVNKTGETVKANDILLSIYSPKLVATQQEYLLALKNLEDLEDSKFEDIRSSAESLVESSRRRLELLDVPEHQIHELEDTKEIKNSLHIHAPVSGTVIRIGARRGKHVTPMTELYMLVDLDQVWVIANIYEYELPWVKEGDKATMTLASLPGKVFTGRLEYIYPFAEVKSRTIKVRMLFQNEELLLRPDLFADVEITADVQKDVIVVPSEAIVRSGDTAQVFVAKGSGKFEPRNVSLGLESDGKVIILKGLKEGEDVVTSSQFLIDSESKLREATAKMQDSNLAPGMDMQNEKGQEQDINRNMTTTSEEHLHD